MGLLTMLRNLNELDARGLSAEPVAAAGATAPSWPMYSRAERVALDVALSIPAVRRADAVISGTISTWDLIAWDPNTGDQVPPTDPRSRFLQQPDSEQLLPWTLRKTMSDLIWRDLSVWKITDRYITGAVARADRLHPDRVDTLRHPLDNDRVDKWLIDGQEKRPGDLIVIDGAGQGGLRRYGWDILTLYGQLQAAAGRYAVAPHPHAILKNKGADLDDDEIDELLDEWEAARATRAVGYLNDAVDYETHGWNAEELQLTEAREYSALEVARLFGLPAKALDAKSGDSMTYANAVEARRDIASALKPWAKPLTAALSAVTGLRVELDNTDYTRDDPKTRMDTWAVALDKKVLTLEEVRALEPLAARRNHR